MFVNTMNMLSTHIVTMLLFAPLVFSQQCRTICNEEPSSLIKGDKGDVGSPGKAGPVGNRGLKGEDGEIGEKGMQGESCALGSFESTLVRKLAVLERLLIPASCRLSSVHGRQTLRTGEEAFCEDGWTVFQRRFSGDVDFHQNWTEYKQGFGDLDGDFWLGLDKIHNLTKDRGCKLRVDIWRTGDVHSYAIYSGFYVENESDNYRLQVSGYNGTAGDMLNYQNGMQFTTKDRDNDKWSRNCAVDEAGEAGGWWFNVCSYSNLNLSPPMYWDPSRNVVKSTMKVRCD